MRKLTFQRIYNTYSKMSEKPCIAAEALAPDQSGQVSKTCSITFVDFKNNTIHFDVVYDMYDYDDKEFVRYTFEQLGVHWDED